MAHCRTPSRYQRSKSPNTPSPAYNSRLRNKSYSPRLSKPAVVPLAPNTAPDTEPRPVLVPLHPNLRRLPSRLMAFSRDNSIALNGYHAVAQVQAGTKRKRVVSGNENIYENSRGHRGPPRYKRRRSMGHDDDSSDVDADHESPQGTMEVDADDAHWDAHDGIGVGEHDFDDTDEFLLYEASRRYLQRLRKDDLIRLYQLTSPNHPPDAYTKSDLVDAIVSCRDRHCDGPPSSPSGRTDHSSGCSSDDGNDGGGEETDVGFGRNLSHHVIGRRVPQGLPRRSLSLNYPKISIPHHEEKSARLVKETNSVSPKRRRHTPGLSSPTPSPIDTIPRRITRLRSRTFSVDISLENVYCLNGAKKEPMHECIVKASEDVADESDLTELSESTDTNKVTSSPRRLRPKLKDHKTTINRTESESKRKSVHRPSDDGGNAGDDDLVEMADMLNSSPSASPEPTPKPKAKLHRAQRTPIKRRLRPRGRSSRPPSDGDDEEEGDEDEVISLVSDEVANDAEEDDLKVEEPDLPPRTLRNGKVLPTSQPHSTISETKADEDGSQDEGSSGGSESGSEFEVTEEEIDLDAATHKSLTRYRRDDLIRLCEARDLPLQGTKAQLAHSLLRWRDCQSNASSSSSTSTAKPPSMDTPKSGSRRMVRKSSKPDRSATPPVLLHSHCEGPRTPPVLSQRREHNDGELELDLESLGLEDREIPPEKLVKLEKIGSGGFKDVFIGKFKGRKVAIAEFRDQLSAMDIKELKLLAEFAHPNIVRFLGVSIPENTRESPVMIVSELCSNGDLFDYIRNVPAPSLHKVLTIMLDISRGLQYLHERKPSVIHRDCKSSNILITSKGTAKIADFGLAKVKQSTRSMVRSLVGTVNWQAPELWNAHPKYNHKVDVFSCACVFWEMLQWHNPTKKFPWEGMNEHAIYEAVGTKKMRPSLSGLKKQWCPEVVDLVDRMWAQDPQDRPAIAEVVDSLQGIMRDHR